MAAVQEPSLGLNRSKRDTHSARAAGRALLSEDDAINVFEEIEEAQNRAYYLGQYLGLHVRDVESIRKREIQARDQLYEVLLQSAKEAKLSWGRVANALRGKLVGLPQLADTIEEKYCRGSAIPELPEIPRTAPARQYRTSEQRGQNQHRRQSFAAFQTVPEVMVVHRNSSFSPPGNAYWGSPEISPSTSPTPPSSPPYYSAQHTVPNLDPHPYLSVSAYPLVPRTQPQPPLQNERKITTRYYI